MAIPYLFRHACYVDRHRPTETGPRMRVGHGDSPLFWPELAGPP